MSMRSWILLALLVALALAANALFGWGFHIFLGRKLADTVEWMAFWR